MEAKRLSAKRMESKRIERATSHLNAQQANRGSSHHAFRLEKAFSDTLGQTHVRFRQTYQGIPVWGGESIVHIDENDTLKESSDAVKRGLQLETEPSLGKTEALGLLAQKLQAKGNFAIEPHIELMVYPMPSGESRLAYYIEAALDNPQDGLQEPHAIVDAHSGEILKQWEGLNTQAVGTGNSQYNGTVKIHTTQVATGFQLRDTTRGVKGNQIWNLNHSESLFEGVPYVDADNTWGDGQNYIAGGSTTDDNGQTAGVDVAYGVQVTWDYYQQVHGRNGFDGNGKNLVAGVHLGNLANNAAWSNAFSYMIFGDGSAPNPGGSKSLTALDIVAHEFSHGVCGNSAKLVYANESGGLNEANSDINACMVEFHARSGGGNVISDKLTSSPITRDGGNWTMGELVEQDPAKPMRYMYKPSLDGICPDFWFPDIADMDVHYSCGPMNRAFYFLSCGATTTGETSTATNTPAYGLQNVNFLPNGMRGIGNDKAARIWYRTLTTYLTTTADYFIARKGCQKAAIDLFGAGSAELMAVNNAFAAINVGHPAGMPDDTQAPEILSLIHNGHTTENITFTVQAQDDYVVSRVLFYVNGVLMGKATANGGSWVFNFDSTQIVNGTHKAKAVVYDGYNNTTSMEVAFSTENSTFHPVLNGGFEQGLANWKQSNCALASMPINIHSGVKALWMGGYGKTATGNISQSFEIPLNANSSTLAFWLRVSTKDDTSANQDVFKVRLLGNLGKELTLLDTFSNQDAPNIKTHTLFTYDLNAYKGSKVTLQFEFNEDAANTSAFFVDDVNVQITTGESNPLVTVTVSPSAVTLDPGKAQAFSATVTGSTSPEVIWTATGGNISTTGLYTAPTQSGTYTVRATSKADSKRYGQATVTVKEVLNTDLLQNGDFEQGANGWTGSTGAISTWSEQKPYGGTKNAWLGGYGKKQTDALNQTVNLPKDASSAKLNFALHIDTAETTKWTAYDKFSVQIWAAGKLLATPLTLSNLNAQAGYQLHDIDLLAYKGQSIEVRFQSVEDITAQTSFVLDSVSLK